MCAQSHLQYLKPFNFSVMKWLLSCGWIILFIGGITHYSGSWVTYSIFSLVFLCLLLSGFYRQISYGYLFLVLMLWLGFWFKLTLHTLVDFKFGEPVGLFDSSPSAWDEVLWIVTIGGTGVLLARVLYGLTNQKSTMAAPAKSSAVPAWYAPMRKWMWFGLVFFSLTIAIVNMVYGIQQSGLAPRTIFVWPLNAIGCWLIGYGITLPIATLLWWDMALGRTISIVVYVVLLEAFSSTVSMLSRGSYIFHVVPQFLALHINRNQAVGWGRRNIIMLSITFVVLFALSNPLVNSLRFYYYYAEVSFYDYYFHNFLSAIPFSWLVLSLILIISVGLFFILQIGRYKLPVTFLVLAQSRIANWFGRLFFLLILLVAAAIFYSMNKSEHTVDNTTFGLSAALSTELNETRKPATLAKFAVDRWIGLEGVMAVMSYPEKSYDLFKLVLSERGEVGKGTIYQEISLSWSRTWDMKKFQVGTLPGAVAFFYLTGHYWVVALGMTFLAFLVISSEGLVFKITGNPLLCALWGGTMANAIIQMGVAPRGLLIYFFELSCAIAVIGLIQSKEFTFLLKKLGLHNK